MFRRVKNLLFRSREDSAKPNSKVEPKKKVQETQSDNEADDSRPTVAEFVSALFARDSSSDEEDEKPIYVLDDLEQGEKKEQTASSAAGAHMILEQQTPAKENSSFLVSSTPLRRPASQPSTRRLPTKRRRYKKYDVNSRRRVINPSSESEEDEPVVGPPSQVIEVNEASGYFQEVQSEIFRDLELQLSKVEGTEGAGAKEAEAEKFYEANSSFRTDVPQAEQLSEVTGVEKEGEAVMAQESIVVDTDSGSSEAALSEEMAPYPKSIKTEADGMEEEIAGVPEGHEEGEERNERTSDEERVLPRGREEVSTPKKRSRRAGPASQKAAKTPSRPRRSTPNKINQRKGFSARALRKLHRDRTGRWTTQDEPSSDSDVIVIEDEEAELLKIKLEHKRSSPGAPEEEIEDSSNSNSGVNKPSKESTSQETDGPGELSLKKELETEQMDVEVDPISTSPKSTEAAILERPSTSSKKVSTPKLASIEVAKTPTTKAGSLPTSRRNGHVSDTPASSASNRRVRRGGFQPFNNLDHEKVAQAVPRSEPRKTASDHYSSGPLRSPKKVSNRYPFASASSPGAVIYTSLSGIEHRPSTAPQRGTPSAPISTTSHIGTQEAPTSRTSHIEEREEAENEKEKLISPTKSASQLTNNSNDTAFSEPLFVSPDSPELESTQKQPPTSPYSQSPVQQKFSRRSEQKIKKALRKTDIANLVIMSSQSDPSSQEKDRLMVPETSAIDGESEVAPKPAGREHAVMSSPEQSEFKIISIESLIEKALEHSAPIEKLLNQASERSSPVPVPIKGTLPTPKAPEHTSPTTRSRDLKATIRSKVGPSSSAEQAFKTSPPVRQFKGTATAPPLKGTLPTLRVIRKESPQPLKNHQGTAKVNLIPMYSKISQSNAKPKSLAEQLRERREKLANSH